MKIVVIGDIHGRTIWKKIVEENKDADKIVFLGDYHDIYSYEFKAKDSSIAKTNSISNLLDIIEYKKQNMDKVILLIGNHDSHYMFNLEKCSRYDFENQEMLRNIFIKNMNLFEYAWQKNNHIFVHAGILQKWFDHHHDDLCDLGLLDDMSNLADILNVFGKNRGKNAVNDISRMRGGYAPFGGITWADIDELTDYAGSHGVKGLHQYVGHNKVNKIFTANLKHESGSEDSSITFVDVLHEDYNKLEFDQKFLILEI